MKRKVLLGPFVGELGWEIAAWHAWCRKLAHDRPGEYWVVGFPDREILYRDFANFYPVGSLNPDKSDSYRHRDYSIGKYFSDLVGHFLAHLSDLQEGVFDEVVPVPYIPIPIARARAREQLFAPLGDWSLGREYKRVVVFPRHRRGAEGCRNWGQEKWAALVEWLLEQGLTVVVAGHPSGACLQEYKPNTDKFKSIIGSSLETVVTELNKAEFAISQQSGTCSLSLLSGCKLLSFGMEHITKRIEVDENPLGTFCKHYHLNHNDIDKIEFTDMQVWVHDFVRRIR